MKKVGIFMTIISFNAMAGDHNIAADAIRSGKCGTEWVSKNLGPETGNGMFKRPARTLIQMAAEHGCMDSFAELVRQADVDDVAEAVYWVPKHINPEFHGKPLKQTMLALGVKADSMETLGDALQPYKAIGDKVSAGCKDGEPESPSCIAKKTLRDLAQSLAQNLSDRQEMQTAGYAQQSYCRKIAEAQTWKAKVDEERAKGQVSGFVNATKMKRFGDNAYRVMKEAEEIANGAKEKHGHALAAKDCEHDHIK